MAPHSSTLAWKISWTEEPGRLQSMGSRTVGHNWATWLSLFTFMHWRRKGQCSCLGNPRDRGAWWAAVHGVAESRTRLSAFTFTFHFHALEKEMAPHSSVLAWRIPGMLEPGGLPSMGSHRVGHDWSDLAGLYLRSYSLNSLEGARFCLYIYFKQAPSGNSYDIYPILRFTLMYEVVWWRLVAK